MNIKILFIMFLVTAGMTVSAQDSITLGSLLKEMTDFSSVARWPSFVEKQASSYDRHSVAVDRPGWFANGDFNQFIRKEEKGGREEYVMMDAEGPGVVVRFWLTTVIKNGKLRFYFDNAAAPAIEIPAYDLMKGGFGLGPGLLNPHSSYEPEGKGGNTLYLPLPYQRHCKITYEFTDSASVRAAHYYQINYRSYPKGVKVRTFAMEDLGRYRGEIDRAERELWHPEVAVAGRGADVAGQMEGVAGRETAGHKVVNAGGKWGLELPAGMMAVREMSLEVTGAGDRAALLRSVILKIDFDGQQTVWCPVGDFSGSGYGGKVISSWYRELSAGGKVRSRWVMPYRRRARVSVINQTGMPVEVALTVKTAPWKWDEHSLYFHATYKYEENIKDAKWDYDISKVALKDTAAPIEWNFITIRGKGIYLGNTLAVNNHMDAWYGEGDAKVWVDADTFPSEFGTGLEDYYNTSWAPVVLYQTPFANAPRADNESSTGHNTFTRTRVLDGVPFLRRFRYDLEMLSWKGGTIDAAAVVYWYGTPGATDR